MANYEMSEELEEIGNKVISDYPEKFGHLADCRIAYLLCDGHKKHDGKTAYADCEKIKDKLKAIMPFDFIITFYVDAIELSGETQEKLMYHELCHVGFDEYEDKYWIIPHDIEDFREVLRLWGVDWAEELKD